jgi:hypothetical protein
MTFHVVPPIEKPDEPRKARAGKYTPSDMLQCPRCEGREVTETVIGGILVGGKLKGGTRQYVCVGCLLKGERVVLA